MNLLEKGAKLMQVSWDDVKWAAGIFVTISTAAFTWFHKRITKLDSEKMDIAVFDQFEKRFDDKFEVITKNQDNTNLALDKIFDKLDGKEDKT